MENPYMKALYTISILLSVFLCACSSERAQRNDTYKSTEDVIDCLTTNIEDFDAIKDLVINNPDQYGKHLTIRCTYSKDGIEFNYLRDGFTWTGSLSVTVDQLFEGETISSFMESYECSDLIYEIEYNSLRLKFENAGLNSGLLYTEKPDQHCTAIEGYEGWYYFEYPLDGI